MRYVVLLVLEGLLVWLSFGKDLAPISAWLIGINFTFAAFSVNFTFFGYQLSRYKSILEHVTRRQWFNIVLLLVLPFIPLVAFLLTPNLYAHIAFVLLPIIVWLAIDNATLTRAYLDPLTHLKRELTSISTESYVSSLYDSVSLEVRVHEQYLKNRSAFQIPVHEFSFKTDLLGLARHDLWDKVAVVLKQAVTNNDYPVFIGALEHAINLLLSTYRYQSKKKDDYREIGGVQSVSSKRFRGLIHWLINNDAEGIYIESFANKLCAFLKSSEALEKPLGNLTENIMSDVTYLGSIMLSSKQCVEPMKILNTIHAVIELAIHQIEEDIKGGNERYLDKYNIAGYAHLIKSLCKDAIYNKNTHFVYRCMETLSYLGCSAAKIHSRQTVVACFESLVQIGRTCRKEGIRCFWSHCIIPLHLHAEEFMGHILTWLVRDLKENGSFTLKTCAEWAFSRIRGVQCAIEPKPNLNPKFWIKEQLNDDTGKAIAHIERLSGMYGYGGEVDYSNVEDATDYRLPDLD